jgi:hypothetical protein
MAAGTEMPHQWIDYWLHKEGAAAIEWGVPGDFDRCIAAIEAKVTEHGKPPLGDSVIKGLCATLHKMATGARPGHAATEQH